MLGYLDFRFPNEGWRKRHPMLANWYQDFAELPRREGNSPSTELNCLMF
jgi:hypothetical protein